MIIHNQMQYNYGWMLESYLDIYIFLIFLNSSEMTSEDTISLMGGC